MLIRHSAVDSRRENMGRRHLILCVGETVGKMEEVDERTGACGQCHVRQGMGHDTWMAFV